MFKTVTCIMLGLLFTTLATRESYAQNLNLPAQSQWVLSLDLQAVQKSKLLAELLAEIDPEKRKQANLQLNGLNAMFGIDLLKDIERLAIVGNGAVDKGGVAYIFGRLPQERITAVLALSKNYTSSDHHGIALQSWFDESDKKSKYLAFAGDGLTLVANKREPLAAALDTLAGRTPALPENSLLANACKSGCNSLLRLSAQGLAALVGAQPNAEMLKQADAINLTLNTPDNDTLALQLSMTAKDATTAQQLQQALIGIQAITMLRAAEDPELAAIAQKLVIKLNANTLNLDLNFSGETLTTLLKNRQQREKNQAAGQAQ